VVRLSSHLWFVCWCVCLLCAHALGSSMCVPPLCRLALALPLASRCAVAMSRAGKVVAPLMRRAQRLAVVPKRYGSGGAVVNPSEADLYAGGLLTGVRPLPAPADECAQRRCCGCCCRCAIMVWGLGARSLFVCAVALWPRVTGPRCS